MRRPGMSRLRALLAAGAVFLAMGAARAAGPADPSPAERGAYLARAGDCVACHTAPSGKPFAGGLPMSTPIGTIYSTNITPDRDTGIGGWSFEEFDRLMRRGIRPEGGTVYPAMPYPSYSRLTEADMRALYAYFTQSVEPVRQANRDSDIPWPLSMRWPLALWRTFFAPSPQPFQPQPGQDPRVARGAYLVEGLGHCGACHTPRALTMQEEALTNGKSVFLSGGGPVDGWIAPSLRNEHGGGLAAWSEAEIVAFLKTGRNAHTATFGAMNDVVVHSMQYLTDEDLGSIAAYLKSLAPHRPEAPPYRYDETTATALFNGDASARGAQIYVDRCAGCHRTDGKGYANAFPALAGNAVLQTDNGTSAIHIVLSGGRLPGTHTAPSAFTMAPYAGLLSDEQVADVVSFIQTGWGNRGKPVTAEDVRKMREQAEPVKAEGWTSIAPATQTSAPQGADRAAKPPPPTQR
ncbi:MAG: alcohol dehydrogenase [Azospirillum brasilense]|nr:MAG: alcohol dehydrogenase [Azospirillum brasilense]